MVYNLSLGDRSTMDAKQNIFSATWLEEALQGFNNELVKLDRELTRPGRPSDLSDTFLTSDRDSFIEFMEGMNKNKDQSRIRISAIEKLMHVFCMLSDLNQALRVTTQPLNRLYGVLQCTLTVGHETSRESAQSLEFLGFMAQDLQDGEDHLNKLSGYVSLVTAFDIFASLSLRIVDFCTKVVQQGSPKEIFDSSRPDLDIERYVEQFKTMVRTANETREERNKEKELYQKIEAEQQRKRAEDLDALEAWLKVFALKEADNRHDEVKRDRQDGTGQWFLKSVTDWMKRDPRPVLWAEGKPGVGKTVLISHVVDHFHARVVGPDTTEAKPLAATEPTVAATSADAKTAGVHQPCVAYIYFAYDLRQRQTPRAVLGSILLALLRTIEGCPAKVKKLKEDCEKDKIQPKDADLLTLLTSLPGSILIVFDALDEADVDLREQILEWISGMKRLDMKSTSNCLRVLLSTRPDVRRPVTDGHVMFPRRIESSTNDMTLYVRAKLSTNQKLQKFERKRRKKGTSLLDKMVEAVVKNAEHMFLLAVFRTRDICAQMTAEEMMVAAETHDTNPNEIYTRTLNQIAALPPSQVKWAHKTIGWLTFARTTLDVEELREALAIEPGTYVLNHDRKPDAEDLAQICRGLIILDEERHVPRLRLAHKTVQEHFSALPAFQPMLVEICGACFTYLILSVSPGGRPTENDDESNEDGSDRESESEDLGEDQEEHEEWYDENEEAGHSSNNEYGGDHETVDEDQRYLEDASPSIGNRGVLEELELSQPWSSVSSMSRTFSWSDSLSEMSLASAADYRDAVQEWPHSLVAWTGEHYPLSYYSGSYALTHLNMLAREQIEDALREILFKFTNIMFSARRRRTIEDWSASAGKASHVQKRPLGMKPLHLAVLLGDVEVCKKVLNQVPDQVNDLDEFGRTPLAWALGLLKSPELINLLLNEGGNPNLKDSQDRPALHYASYLVSLELLERLFAATDPEKVDGRLLIAASMANNLVMAKMLLKMGISADFALGLDSKTPLHIAAEWEHLEMALLLLAHKASVLVQDVSGKTPLAVAILHHQDEMVRLLLKQTGALNIADQQGRTPLAIAIESENQSAFDYLLNEPDVNLATRTTDGQNLFKLSTRESDTGTRMTLRLLEALPDFAFQEPEPGSSPFYVAAARGQYQLCLRLLALGSPVGHHRRDGRDTAFLLACFHKKLPLMELLIDCWAWLEIGPSTDLVPVVDDSGRNALHLAASSGHVDVAAKLLTLQGLSLTETDRAGDTALHVGVQSGNLAMVQLLLGHGADPNTTNWSSKSPLDHAIALGDEEVLRTLTAAGARIGLQYSEESQEIQCWAGKPWFLALTQSLRGSSSSADTVRYRSSSTWIQKHAKNTQLLSVYGSSPDTPYLAIDVPGTSEACIRRIVFRTVSHDQGWSNDASKFGGTYNYTYSWFEAGISRPATGEDGAANGRIVQPRRVVQRNVHASKRFRVHQNIWDYRDPAADLREWLNSIRGGDTIQLFAKALYSGWENVVAEAEISIYYEITDGETQGPDQLTAENSPTKT